MSAIKGKFVFSALVLGVFGFALAAAAAMPESQRLAIIKGLKIKGVIGENNQGYLEFRGEKQAVEVVRAENEERRKDYQSIAAKRKSSVAEVGRLRAKQIAEMAEKGIWLQSPDGKWHCKK